MAKQRKVFIVAGNPDYGALFVHHGWQVVDQILDSDLVQFCGGSDVTPSYYGEYRHKLTQNNPIRDARERVIFDLCRRYNHPMAGICRGGQFLNVMCGGRLYQNVNNHVNIPGHVHKAHDVFSDETFEVTSTHHQMMRPGKESFVFLEAKQATMLETCEKPGKETTHLAKEPDVEGCYYYNQYALCFQPHPEWSNMPELGERYMGYISSYFDL